MKTYQRIAALIQARANCERTGNTVWRDKHTESIADLLIAAAPRGSGFDSGTDIDLARSNPERLVFDTSFHHMDDMGMYDGWTDHVITVRPSLASGFVLGISGPDRNQIKEYLHDIFAHWLDS